MEISVNGNKITILGSVSKYEDYVGIKHTVDEVIAHSDNTLEIEFVDAMTVNSALIGYMIKCVKVQNIDVSISVVNHKLYEMLNLLSLTEVLKVKKVK